jgi:hypothetical protein
MVEVVASCGVSMVDIDEAESDQGVVQYVKD